MVIRTCIVALAVVLAATACGSPASPTLTPLGAPGSATPTPPSPLPGALRLEAASVIEIQYPGSSHWFYAPQLWVTETTGVGDIRVISVQFTIPGFHGRPWTCTTGQRVEAGQTRELLPELYGDYPLTFDETGVRATGDVTVVIGFVDDSGRAGTLTAGVPITPGALPTTYTGGNSRWSCGA